MPFHFVLEDEIARHKAFLHWKIDAMFDYEKYSDSVDRMNELSDSMRQLSSFWTCGPVLPPMIKQSRCEYMYNHMRDAIKQKAHCDFVKNSNSVATTKEFITAGFLIPIDTYFNWLAYAPYTPPKTKKKC